MLVKRIVLTTLLILWMIVIFMFSSEDATNSQNTSDKVTKTTINVVSSITKNEVSDSKKENITINTRFIVRKMAHFTLYFILGIFTYLTLSSYGIDKNIIIYSVIFCLIYSISDEIHQVFSDGRTFKVLDILIDTIGSITSNLLIKLIITKKRLHFDKKCSIICNQ